MNLAQRLKDVKDERDVLEAELAKARKAQAYAEDANHCKHDVCWLHGKNPAAAERDALMNQGVEWAEKASERDALKASFDEMNKWMVGILAYASAAKLDCDKAEARVAELERHEHCYPGCRTLRQGGGRESGESVGQAVEKPSQMKQTPKPDRSAAANPAARLDTPRTVRKKED